MEGATSASVCKDCEAGKHGVAGAAGLLARACTSCERGRYQTLRAETACRPCAPGYYWDAFAAGALAQGKEYVRHGQGVDDGGPWGSTQTCRPCLGGKYQPLRRPVSITGWLASRISRPSDQCQ